MANGSEDTMPMQGGQSAQGAATPPPSQPGTGSQAPSVHIPSQSGAPTAFSLSGTNGLPPVSQPVQDLSQDKLLLSANRVTVDGKPTPALGGIPLLTKLGQGGMGAVYYGIHPRLKLEVAVKVLPFHLAGSQPALIERFFREAQIAAKVQSPHLVNVKDVNEDCGLFYLVMEYVHGTSAGSYLKQVKDMGRPGLPESEALAIVIAATEGLKSAHDQNVVHRDVKPDNIMIPKSKSGGELLFKNAKLADLGLARGDDGAQQGLTATQVALGTPGYMAPEQADDARTAGKPADVFSMGAALYALLSGGAPFKGESLMKIFFATAQKPHEPIQQLRPEVGAATAALIDRCLAKDPAQRPADATMLLEQLAVCRDQAGQGAAGGPHASQFAPTIVGAAAPGSKAATEFQPPGSIPGNRTSVQPQPSLPPEPPAPKRWPKVLAAAVVILVLLGAAGSHLKEKERQAAQAKFVADRDVAAAAGRNAATAHGDQLAQAIADLERFKQERAEHTLEDFKPVEEVLDQLHDRQDLLARRRDSFNALVADARRMIPVDPREARKKIEEAEKLGAAAADGNLPDLLAEAKLDALKTEAQRFAEAFAKRESDEKAAHARSEFEAAFAAARDAAAREEWPAAEATVRKALEALGAQDHPAKDGAQALLKTAENEQGKREEFGKLLLQGNRLLKDGKFEGAREHFEKARALWPKSPENERINAGVATALQGIKHVSYESAMQEGREALKNREWDKAETAFNRALYERKGDRSATQGLADAQSGAKDKRYADAFQSGQSLLKDKKYQAAAMAFTSALDEKRTKEAADALSAAQYEAAMDEARKAAADRRWFDAERELRKALSSKPNDPSALTGLNLIQGFRKLELKDYAGAETSFNAALQTSPDNKSAKDGLASAQKARQTGYDEAMGRARLKSANADSVLDWTQVKNACDDALAVYPSDKAAQALKNRALGEIDRLTRPTLKVVDEIPLTSVRSVKLNNTAVSATGANTVEPGRYLVEVEISVPLGGRANDISRSLRVTLERGRNYEIRFTANRKSANRHEVKLYEDGKHIDFE
ncbi:MAG: protein kinase [Planctomycetota bacterium]|nr:protein kinase [Planctomycetota bacterium]